MASSTKQAPYVRGTQDVSENRKTFQWFWDATVVSIVLIVVTLALLAYLFT